MATSEQDRIAILAYVFCIKDGLNSKYLPYYKMALYKLMLKKLGYDMPSFILMAVFIVFFPWWKTDWPFIYYMLAMFLYGILGLAMFFIIGHKLRNNRKYKRLTTKILIMKHVILLNTHLQYTPINSIKT